MVIQVSTVNELLLLIQTKYPSATSQTDMIKFMNIAQAGLSSEFGLVATDESLVTVAHNDQYAFPTGIEDISQIETFDIATNAPDTDKLLESTNMKVGAYTLIAQPDIPSRISFTHVSVGATDTLGTLVVVGVSGGVSVTETVTPVADSTVYSDRFYTEVTSVTGAGWGISAGNDTLTIGVKLDRYDVERYPIGFSDDRPFVPKCIYQVYSTTGVKSLIIYPAPTVSGIPITIRYKKNLKELSATDLTASPEFDSRYHDMLATYACYEICANGASPDDGQRERFAAEYDGRLNQIFMETTKQKLAAPKKSRANRMWRRRY